MSTVLLVEDDEFSREIYATYLSRVGHDVLLAADGESGVAIARARRPDMVLMDLSLPGIDGYAATSMLKGDDRTRDIPVVALTGRALEIERARASEVGCDGFLAKPMTPKQLAEEVRVFLAQRGD
jgi:two-component system cell cycle response regulator DivK